MSRHTAPVQVQVQVQVQGANGSVRAILDQRENVFAGEVSVEPGARRHMTMPNPHIRSVIDALRQDRWAPPPPRTGSPGPGGEPVVEHGVDAPDAESDGSAEGLEAFAALRATRVEDL
jgi:hypothetical protein